ncbi:MAG: DUF6603 domain-containing protein [Ginsengibacter sp.]
MLNQLSYLYLAVKDFITPLNKYFSSAEGMEYLFYRYGWDAPVDDDLFLQINKVVSLKKLSDDCIQFGETLEAKIESDSNTSLSEADISSMANFAQKLYQELSAFKLSDFTTLPEPLNDAGFWSDFGDQLLDDLQETYIRVYYPKVYAFLHLFGVITYESENTTSPHRNNYTRTVVDWGQIVDIAGDPLKAFKKTYHWDDTATPFDYAQLLSALQKVIKAIGLSAKLAAPDNKNLSFLPGGGSFSVKKDTDSLRVLFLYALSVVDNTVLEAGLQVYPAIKTGETVPSGLLITPVLRGGMETTISLGKDFQIKTSGAIDAGSGLGVIMFPGNTGLTTGTVTTAAGLEFGRINTTEPWYLIGNSKTSRVELSGISAGISMEGAVTDPDIKFHFTIGVPGSGNGCKVIIQLDESDSLVKTSTGKNNIEFDFDAQMVWSTKTGLQFNGDAALEVQLPVHIKLGAVTLQNVMARLAAGTKSTSVQGIELQLTGGLKGAFGPVSFEIDGLGLGANVIPYSKDDLKAIPAGSKPPLFGKFDLSLSFVPPKGIGIEVNANAITGGGYLFFDPEKGEYAGVAQLTIQNKIVVKAIGIVQTKLPDGKPGYSFLLIITAEFPAIQLGMGFSLTGVGGLVGINRSIDMAKLENGIFNNSIDDVLFPADPLHNAYALINSINQIFPATSNQYIIGVMAQIAWGAANIVTIELGLILEFPEPLTVVLLGVIRAEVKKKLFGKEITALHLQVNFRISIEFDRKFIKMDAALYQSKLIGMELTGQIAVRVKYGSNDDFAISIGGFFPGFQPPALELPAKIDRLQIILNSGNPYIAVGCYLAVTSNTIQFGIFGTFSLEKYGCKILGDISFDALFQISPFHFEVDIHVFFGVSWHGYDLASIKLDGSFSGPSPWHITGTMELSVWIFSKTVHVNETWGDDDDTALEKVSVLPLLAQDIGSVANWERTNGSTATLVTLRKDLKNEPDAEMLMLHPNELLTVRQNTVPLGISIDKFGARKPMGANKFDIQLIDKNNAAMPAGKVQNRFAPAQFIDLTDDQKLNAPSYELFDAGISFDGLDNVMFDNFITIPVTYESRIIDDPMFTPTPPVKIIEINSNFIHGLLNSSLSNSILGQLPKPKSIVAQTIREQYLVADAVTMKADAVTAVFSNNIQAMQKLKTIRQTDFYNNLHLTVLPIEEALA